MHQLVRPKRGLLALLAAIVSGGAICSTGAVVSADNNAEGNTPIQHTIVLYQENISFDHYFGTYGHGSNGIPAGSTLSHTNGTSTWGPYSPTQLNASQFRTCDVDHGYKDMINMSDHGAMDKFLQFGNDKTQPQPGTNPATCPTFEAASAPPGTNLTALANSYYTGTAGDPNSPLQNYWRLASQYTLADNFFQGVYGPSTPGAEWLVAATNNTTGDPNPIGDVCDDYPASIPQVDIPNLGEEASAQGVSWAWFQGGLGTCTQTPANPDKTGYSAHHNPFNYFTSTADLTHTWANDPRMDYSQPNRHQRDLSVLDAALAGTAINGVVPKLPAISWVKADQPEDGHPGYSGPALEDAYIGDFVNRLQHSRYWNNTAVIIAFDETGGWWDHVAPPDLGGNFATYVNGQPNTGGGCQYAGIPGAACAEAGFGPRMPVLVISKYAKHGFIDHTLMNTASLDGWVEANHGLPALGVWGNRDTAAGSLMSAFDFSNSQ